MRGEGQQPATKADMQAFATKDDLKALSIATKADFNATRADIQALSIATRADIQALSNETKADIAAFRVELRDMLRPIIATLANHTAELADIRSHIKDKMVTRDEFHSRMDAFVGRFDDSDYSSTIHRSRLDDHEKRIRALERKPS